MSKKLLVILSIVAVIVTTVLAACAPAAAPPPARTPPAATPPPATPKPVEPKFTAASYTNEQYGFSLMYPKKWEVYQAVTAPSIWIVKENNDLPTLDIMVFNKASVSKEFDDMMASRKLTGAKNVVQWQDFKLADGKVGQYSVNTSEYPGYPMRSFLLWVEKGDKIISFAITNFDGSQNEALYKDIFSTIVFK